MLIGRGVGPLEWAIAVVAALYCAVVAYKAFDYVRGEVRRRRTPDPPAPRDGEG